MKSKIASTAFVKVSDYDLNGQLKPGHTLEGTIYDIKLQ